MVAQVVGHIDRPHGAPHIQAAARCHSRCCGQLHPEVIDEPRTECVDRWYAPLWPPSNAAAHRPAAFASACALQCRRCSPGYKLNRLMNNNLSLFQGAQRRQVQTLAGGRHAFLLRHWPKPGVNDSAKRALVAKAAAGAPSSEVEQARIGA